MTIAEEQIKQMILAMTDDEKKIVAQYLDSEFMRDELQRRYINTISLFRHEEKEGVKAV